MTKQRKIIEWAQDSLKDIKRAERQKARLENEGYTLVQETCSFTTGRFIYEKKQ